jgi:cold-inducible RNA-binding protein
VLSDPTDLSSLMLFIPSSEPISTPEKFRSLSEWIHERRSKAKLMPKLYVGNLPRSVTEGSLEEFLQAAQCQVENIKLVRDLDTGLPRGFAFVELAAGADLQGAIQKLNGQSMEGRQLVVNEARPQAPRPGGGGAGGRRFDNRPRRGGGGGGRGRGGGGRSRY